MRSSRQAILSQESGAAASDGSAQAGELLEFAFAFHAHRAEPPTPYRVVDGGVMDNIPIERALRTVRTMSADNASDRVLLYLDPKPSKALPPNSREPYDAEFPRSVDGARVQDRDDPLSKALRAAARAYKHFIWVESGQDEADAVEAFRRDLTLGAGRDAGLWAIHPAAELNDANLKRAYSTYRTASDGVLFSRVLGDPSIWQLGSTSRQRKIYRAWTATELAALDITMKAQVRPEIALDPITINDTCLALLSWTGAIEDFSFSETRVASRNVPGDSTGSDGELTNLEAIRERLFGLLQIGLRARDQRLAGLLTDGPPASLVGWNDEITTAELTRALPPSSPVTVEKLKTLLRDVVKALDATGNSTTGWPESESSWTRFNLPEDASPARAAHFMVARGIPEALVDIRYWQTTSEQTVIDGESFAALISAQRGAALQRALRAPATAISAVVAQISKAEVLGAHGKLTGASLAGFAGFLSKDWRNNDWFWGRIDSASSTTDLLMSMPPVITEADHAKPTPALQASLIRQLEEDAAELTPGGGPLNWAVGGDTHRNLQPSYRTSMATNALHAVVRSISVSNVPLSIALFLLRPALGGLVALVDPPRFATMLSFILAGVILLGEVGSQVEKVDGPWLGPVIGEVGTGATPAFLWLIGVAAVFAVPVVAAAIATVKGQRSWAAITTRISPTPDWISAEERHTLNRTGLWMLTGFSLVVAGVVGSEVVGLSPLGTACVVLAGVASLQIASRKSTGVRHSNGYRGRDRALLAFSIIPLAAAAIAAEPIIVFLMELVGPQASVAWITAIVAFAVWMTLSWGTVFGIHRDPQQEASPLARVCGLIAAAAGVLASIAGFLMTFGVGVLVAPTIPGLLAAAALGAFLASHIHWVATAVLPAVYRPADRTRRKPETD